MALGCRYSPLAFVFVSVGLVQRHHVRSWADRVDARYGLAELVLRLVRENATGPVTAEFAIDEGVDLGGFDGRVRSEGGSRWVPDGDSVWELSVRRDVGTKADQDYAGRVTAPPGWSMSDTVYSAVSLRAWQRRDAWAEAKTAENRWSKVQALGLDDIMSWLSMAPHTESWLAERLELHPDELEPAAGWWERHQNSTGNLFNRAVVLSGRGDAAEDLQRLIAAEDGPVIVEAAAVGEALEFIAAVGLRRQGAAGGELLIERMVFVTGPNAWRRLLAEKGPSLVLVATKPEFGVNLAATPHTLILPVETYGGDVVARPAPYSTRSCVIVPRLDCGSVAEALSNAAASCRGIDFHRAQDLGALGRRSASALRRHLSIDPVIRSPLWARTDTASSVLTRRAKTAALLAGAWTTTAGEQEDIDSDPTALAELAGRNLDYDTVESELLALTRGADPMLSVSGSTWRLVNPQEAWQLLADHLLTHNALQRFLRVAKRVLGERDPLADVSGVERLTAQVQGVGRVYSQSLRHGMACSLALLSTLGQDLMIVTPYNVVVLAHHCVDQLLRGEAEEDGTPTEGKIRRLADLADVLPLLAEAAPSKFISAIDCTLRHPSKAAGWFTDSEDNSIVGIPPSPHTSLLFALETLAWLPDHLVDVADILVRLEVADPGGRLANRPSGSFSAIFSIWAPQTSASHQERLKVLTGLRDRLVDQADDTPSRALIRLLAKLIPRDGSVVIPGSRPQVRDYQLPQVRRDRDVKCEHVEEVSELILSLVEHRVREHKEAQGMLDVLETTGGITTATSLAPAARERLWKLVEEALTIFAPEELTTVGQRLVGIARLHENYPDVPWALPTKETKRIVRIAEQISATQLAPDEVVEANVWLFEHWNPHLGPEFSPAKDLPAYDEELSKQRATAVGNVIRAEGLNGLHRLAARATAKGSTAPLDFIGVALERVESQAQEADNKCPRLPLKDVERLLLRALDLPIDYVAVSAHEKNAVQIAHGYFGARFRRRCRIKGDGWAWIGQLLRDESLSTFQQARLIELTRDHPRAWREAEALGSATLAAYWKLMNWAGLGLDFEYVEDVVRGFLGVGRVGAAVAVLNVYDDNLSLKPDRRCALAIEVLEALNPNDTAQMTELVHHRQITELFDFVAQCRPLTGENLNDPLMQRLVQLAMAYSALRDLDEPTPFIHDLMALEPSKFVDLIRTAYRPAEAQSQDHNRHTNMSPKQLALRAEQAKAAHRILCSWQRPPGLDSAGIIQYEQLRSWIDEAQRLLGQSDCRRVGDEHIGRVLSAAPPDPTDLIAPPITIRRLLEEGLTPKLEDGLAMGLESGPTGIRGGLVTEMVAKSLQAQEQLTRDATKVAPRWPRTARLLRRVAASHGHTARSWQSEE